MFDAIRAFFEANPLAFYGLLSVVICAINGGFVYWTRKRLPALWVWFEKDSKVASELLKSMPGTFPLAVIGAGAGGAKVAFWGYLIGIASIVGHHVLKILPSWLAPYRGALGSLLDSKLRVPGASIVFSLMLFLAGCAGAAQALQTIKTISDVARDLCMVTGVDKTGLDPKAVRDKFCETEEQLRPWIGLAREAQQTGAMQTGMSRDTK